MTKGLRISTFFHRKTKCKVNEEAIEVEITARHPWCREEAVQTWDGRGSTEDESIPTWQLSDPPKHCLCPVFSLGESRPTEQWQGIENIRTTFAVPSATDELYPESRSPDLILQDILTRENLKLSKVSAYTPRVTSSAAVYAFPSQAKVMVLPSLPGTEPAPVPVSVTSGYAPPTHDVGAIHEGMARRLLFMDNGLSKSQNNNRLSIDTECTLVDESWQKMSINTAAKKDYLHVTIPDGSLATEEMFLPNPYE